MKLPTFFILIFKPKKENQMPPKSNNEKPLKMPTIAEYIGAIGRWCSLNHAVPDFTTAQDRATMEFEAFNQSLSETQKNNRNQTAADPEF